MSRTILENTNKQTLNFDLDSNTAKGEYTFCFVRVPSLTQGLSFEPFDVKVSFEGNIDYDTDKEGFDYMVTLDYTKFDITTPEGFNLEGDYMTTLKSSIFENVCYEFSKLAENQ